MSKKKSYKVGDTYKWNIDNYRTYEIMKITKSKIVWKDSFKEWVNQPKEMFELALSNKNCKKIFDPIDLICKLV